MNIKINTEFIKLNQLLKFSGVASTGGEADILIREGQVLVNDEVCTMRGKKIRGGDRVKVDGETIEVI
ncbi:MAG: RNA-binding S4 domain-containing protein [Clostridia bacterium]|nr:RNA-binding S4 domain-containing protein [Clostridia bacterium]